MGGATLFFPLSLCVSLSKNKNTQLAKLIHSSDDVYRHYAVGAQFVQNKNYTSSVYFESFT